MKKYFPPLVLSALLASLGVVGAARLATPAGAAPPPPLSECECRTTSVHTSIPSANGPQSVPLGGAMVAHCRCGALDCVATFYNVSGTGTAISCR